MLPLVESLGQRAGDTRAGAFARDGLAAMLVAAACCGPALADDPSPSAEDRARMLADEVLRRAESSGPEGLGDWTRSIIGRALERAGEAASQTAASSGIGGSAGATPASLPAERHAVATGAGLAGRANTGDVLVFLSLAVPPASWEQWARAAARTGVPLLLHGAGPAGFRATVMAIGERLDGHGAGVAIDPRLFRLFRVERVPAVVVVPGGVRPCASPGCADDAPPPFDIVTGNIGLAAALEAIASEGDAGRHIARARLERLRGED